ncbi:dynein axonemal intermediate chain 3 [Eucyclogobius newberryi]|uniref:dynein axonemal intermediate chain 3 n=1 Tax=Eucyclogobius newberryi TaxID=166745 RepID=UPI003B5A5B71
MGHNTEHPGDIFPLVLTSMTQELFDCVADEDVTGDSPYKLLQKDDIVQDIRNRAAVSDFSPVKKLVLDYPEDELLLVYDRDFTHGQSFYLVLTPEAKDKLLHPPKPPTPVESVIEICRTPEAKPWISLGSELEIEEESVRNTREKLRFKFSRMRRKFGAAPCFSDRSAADVKDGYLECASYQDSRFSIGLRQRDSGVQAASWLRSSSAQTLWKRQKNMCTQYEPELLPDEERKQLLQSEHVKNFLDLVTPRVIRVLQQETIMNVFCDDWKDQGTEDEGDWSVKATEGLMLYQTFTDQKHMKDKQISCLNWHPTIYGVVAVSVTGSAEKEGRKAATPSFILFYSFADPCTPQLLLECPDNILAFAFSPSDPNVMAGGCVNGQVVLWDISAYVTHLQGIQPGERKGSVSTKAFDLDNIKENETPVVRYCALSALENSHKAPVTDVQWLPQTFEVTKAGLPVENKHNVSVQIVTCSPDCYVFFWDIRVSTLQPATDKKPRGAETSPYSAPETFKHLDRTWTPLFRVSLPKIEASGEYAPLKLCFEEYTCNSKRGKQADDDGDESSKVIPDYSELRIPSARTLTALNHVNTKLYIGTEDGEIVYTDWKMEKDEQGRLQSGKPLRCLSVHHWFVNTVQRSPFFKDIILTIGGWNFAIWKEGVMDTPIFQSACSEQLYTVGCWSLSRPAVFFVGREDGGIELWNLLEKTSEPTQTLAHVINAKINRIKAWHASSKQHFLAVCDDLGMIRVFEIPRAFYAPIKHESVSMRKYFELEQNRIKDLMAKEETWTNHKGGDELKKKAEPEKSVKVREESEEEKVYDAYKNMEESVLKSMGLLPAQKQ